LQIAFSATLLLLIVLTIVLLVLVTRKDQNALVRVLTSLNEGQAHNEQFIRTEFARNREETGNIARQDREELANSFRALTDSLSLGRSEFVRLQQASLTGFAGRIDNLAQTTEQRLEQIRVSISEGQSRFTAEMGEQQAGLRVELSTSVNALSEGLQTRLSQANTAQKGQLDSATSTLTQALNTLTRTTQEQVEHLRSTVDAKLLAIQNDSSTKLEQIRINLDYKLSQVTGAMTQALELFTHAIREQSAELKQNVETKLTAMQNDSASKLEHIRLTVDEKLHSTLEHRLGESFKLVSERLEQVHVGLGEMKVLASGVGDLKKVLTNIKARGNWGEVQLGNLLEQMLSADQYSKNVKVNPESGERVEYAIKLPGHDSYGAPVWLPIDAKFPQEDYQRLVEASEQGDAAGIAAHSQALDHTVFAEAKKIREKYIHPPHTTDFAILFLSTEALFAEILRKPGACDRIIAERVVLAGPTTLAALLNSLQMGFRTLAIEKRSSEVWNVLGAVKNEFSKFGDALGQVENKLREASTKIGAVHTRSRVLARKLKEVQELPEESSSHLLRLPPILISTPVDLTEPELESEPPSDVSSD
jgi:DNA recombination protein RmuC